MSDLNQERREHLLILKLLSEAIDVKDPYTYGHVERVARYSMKILENYSTGLSSEEFHKLEERLVTSALLHDVGKIKIPSKVLLKPDKLTNFEFYEMQLHSIHGCTILPAEYRDWIGKIIRAHHERLNGNGYPDGKKGDDIPLEARIIKVADDFDAGTSKRIYRKNQEAKPDEKVLAELDESFKNGEVEPAVVSAFQKAYQKGDILLAKAAAYTDIRNTEVAYSGGDSRPTLEIAQLILEKVYQLINNEDDSLQKQRTELKIILRQATIYNFQGNPQAAIAKIQLLSENNPYFEEFRPLIILQTAIAQRESGNMSEAKNLATQIISSNQVKAKDWLQISATILLGKLAYHFGDMKSMQDYINQSEEILLRMQEKIKSAPSLGSDLAWLNRDKIAWFEGMILLIKARLQYRLGDKSGQDTAQKANEHFERHNFIIPASKARLLLACYLYGTGNYYKAIFYLEREISFAQTIGDIHGIIIRNNLLAEAYMRKALNTDNTDEKTIYTEKSKKVVERNLLLLDASIPNDITYQTKGCAIWLKWLMNRGKNLAKEIEQLREIYSHRTAPGFCEIDLLLDWIILDCNNFEKVHFQKLAEKMKGCCFNNRHNEMIDYIHIKFL